MSVRAVFLVGFMACGKSSVGQELARRLDWDFVDLDLRMESREQQTIPEIFRDRGEAGFRLAETNALRDLTDALERDPLKRNTVVALGGGAFAEPQNRKLLRSWPSVFLDAPIDELWRRSVEDATIRPLRNDRTEFARLHEHRLPFYRQATVTIVTSGKDPASLCEEIERTLQSWGRTEAEGSSQTLPTWPGTGESQ
ncbi:MAG: shikimate kinase [Terriglobales bacterium]